MTLILRGGWWERGGGLFKGRVATFEGYPDAHYDRKGILGRKELTPPIIFEGFPSQTKVILLYNWCHLYNLKNA